MASLSLVMPLTAPRFDVREILEAWSEALRTTTDTLEILLIDDANAISPDDDWLGEVPGLRVIHHASPLGLGAALQTGVDLARNDWILAVSADRQFAPADAVKMVKQFDVDVAAGYRALPVPGWLKGLDLGKRALSRILLGDAPEARPTWLGLTGCGRRLLARRMFGLGVRDPECGLFLAKRTMFERLRIQSRGTFAWIEVLAKANHLGMMIAEAPLTWQPQPRLSTSFATDAHVVFRHPDFGPPPPVRS